MNLYKLKTMKRILFTLLFYTIAFFALCQTDITAGMTGLQSRTAINRNFDSIYSRTPVVSVADFGAVGNGVTDDRTAIQNAINNCKGRNYVLSFPKSVYYCSAGLTVNDDIIIRGNNTKIIFPSTATVTGLHAYGRIGGYKSISNEITRGQNWLVAPDLADSLSPGDIIKVFSAQPFSDSLYNYQEASGRGEMKVVRNVVGDYIYTDPFEWWYSNSDWTNGLYGSPQASNLGVAKVYGVSVDIDGLTLSNNTTTFNVGSSTVRGAKFTYVVNSSIDLTVENFTEYGITAEHVYSCDFNVRVYNSVRDAAETGDGAPGYGFELVGTSMNSYIRGVIKNCRHCFAYNSSAGVGWGNVVSLDATGTRGNGTLDCHGVCGSIEFRDCIIRGGPKVFRVETTQGGGFDPQVSTDYTQPYGIEIGAKFSYINNCTFINVNSPIQQRESFEMDVFQINNVYFENCTGYALSLRSSFTTGSVCKNLSVNGVYGDCVGFLSIPATNHLNQASLFISNVNLKGGVSSISGNYALKNLTLNNVSLDFNSANAGILIQNLTNARILNCSFRNSAKSSAGVLDVKAVTGLLDIQGTEFNNVVRPVNWTDAAGAAGDFSGYTTITTTVRFINNYITSVSNNNGVLSVPNYTKFTNLMISGNILDDNDLGYFMGRGTGSAAVNYWSGQNITHSAYLSDVQNETNTSYKVISGTLKEPRLIMGYGSPEGVVAAKIGALFLRQDGSTSTTLYVKTTGVSNTGWTAK